MQCTTYTLHLCFRELPWVEEENDRVQNMELLLQQRCCLCHGSPLCSIPVERTGANASLSSNAVQKYPMCDVHCGFATIMYKGNHSMTVGLLHSCVLRKMTPRFPHRKHQNHVIAREPRSCLPPAEAQMPAPISWEVPPRPGFGSPFSHLSSPTAP